MKWIKIALIIVCIWPVKEITIERNNQVIQYEHVKENVLLIIEFDHSVSKTHITESYSIDGQSLINVETQFYDQGGAGMPNPKVENIKFRDAFYISSYDVIEMPLRMNSMEGDHLVITYDDMTYISSENALYDINISYSMMLIHLINWSKNEI